MWRLFSLFLFLTSHSFGATGRICSAIMAFPGYLHLYFSKRNPLRKHAYSNVLKILPPKNENFQIKNSDIFHISSQNMDCVYSLEPPQRSGSNEYPQSMFLSRNKKMYTPVNPSVTV